MQKEEVYSEYTPVEQKQHKKHENEQSTTKAGRLPEGVPQICLFTVNF